MGQLPGRTFGEQLQNWKRKVAFRERAVFTGTAQEVLRSIVEGSEITGAPGQPVGQYGEGYGSPGQVGGTLKASWQLTFPDENTAEISTNIVYAPMNEDGVSGTGGPYVQRSSVGGRHSVRLTRAGFDRIVASEVRKVQTDAIFGGRK